MIILYFLQIATRQSDLSACYDLSVCVITLFRTRTITSYKTFLSFLILSCIFSIKTLFFSFSHFFPTSICRNLSSRFLVVLPCLCYLWGILQVFNTFNLPSFSVHKISWIRLNTRREACIQMRYIKSYIAKISNKM